MNKFNDYLLLHINELNEEIRVLKSSNDSKRIYDELNDSKEPNKFLSFYSELLLIDASFKEDLDIIKYLVDNNLLGVVQLDEAMERIKNTPSFISLKSSISSTKDIKELTDEIDLCNKILNGETVDFNDFLAILENSTLSEEEKLEVLRVKALESTKLDKTHEQLPDLESISEEAEEENPMVLNYLNIKDKVSDFINKYYFLIENKSLVQVKYYKELIRINNEESIVNYFNNNDELLSIYLYMLIDFKDEADKLIKHTPIDETLLELYIYEMQETLASALETAKKYEEENIEEAPIETKVYFLLNDEGKMFNENFGSEEDKKYVDALISELEIGSFDYLRIKGKGLNHTKVQQTVRKDLNVFVNRKRNYSVSYLRVNTGEEAKTLVLNIDDARNIFSSTISMLKNPEAAKKIYEAIEKIKSKDEEFNKSQTDYKRVLDELLLKRGM